MLKETMFHANTKKEWRDWLRKNHEKEKRVGLIVYKTHTKKPTITHREAIEEAICFGWIDTTIRRLDENRYIRFFAKRNKTSKWSSATLGYAKDLTKQKRMTPAGTLAYIAGLKKKTFDHGIAKNPTMPPDLENELNKSKKAKENFRNFAKSYKRTYLRWIEYAKTQQTRKKRISLVVQYAAVNNKFGFYPQGKKP